MNVNSDKDPMVLLGAFDPKKNYIYFNKKNDTFELKKRTWRQAKFFRYIGFLFVDRNKKINNVFRAICDKINTSYTGATDGAKTHFKELYGKSSKKTKGLDSVKKAYTKVFPRADITNDQATTNGPSNPQRAAVVTSPATVPSNILQPSDRMDSDTQPPAGPPPPPPPLPSTDSSSYALPASRDNPLLAGILGAGGRPQLKNRNQATNFSQLEAKYAKDLGLDEEPKTPAPKKPSAPKRPPTPYEKYMQNLASLTDKEKTQKTALNTFQSEKKKLSDFRNGLKPEEKKQRAATLDREIQNITLEIAKIAEEMAKYRLDNFDLVVDHNAVTKRQELNDLEGKISESEKAVEGTKNALAQLRKQEGPRSPEDQKSIAAYEKDLNKQIPQTLAHTLDIQQQDLPTKQKLLSNWTTQHGLGVEKAKIQEALYLAREARLEKDSDALATERANNEASRKEFVLVLHPIAIKEIESKIAQTKLGLAKIPEEESNVIRMAKNYAAQLAKIKTIDSVIVEMKKISAEVKALKAKATEVKEPHGLKELVDRFEKEGKKLDALKQAKDALAGELNLGPKEMEPKDFEDQIKRKIDAERKKFADQRTALQKKKAAAEAEIVKLQAELAALEKDCK